MGKLKRKLERFRRRLKRKRKKAFSALDHVRRKWRLFGTNFETVNHKFESRTGGFSIKKYITRLLQAAPARNTVRVLDLGCGPGITLKGLEDTFPEETARGRLEVHGVRAERRTDQDVSLKHAKMYTALFEEIHQLFPDHHFSIIYSYSSIFHSDKKRITRDLNSAARVLKHGGKLLLTYKGSIPQEALMRFRVLKRRVYEPKKNYVAYVLEKV